MLSYKTLDHYGSLMDLDFAGEFQPYSVMNCGGVYLLPTTWPLIYPPVGSAGPFSENTSHIPEGQICKTQDSE